jgi:predicted phage tail protein
LRKNILLVSIKPHSVFKPYFKSLDLKADLSTYHDVWYYINAMHPKFIQYVSEQHQNGIQEGFVLLDKNLKEITPEELKIRHCKEGDTIHIVPAIIGEGGKRGLLAILAVAAIFIALPALAGAAGAGGAAAGAATGAATGTSFFGKIGAFLKANPFLSNIVTNVGLALVARLFSSRPQQGEETRQNDLFGSLTNSTSSGTPIALHYGQVRVAGQFVSGFLLTVPHSKGETVTTSRRIIPLEAKN